jgi:hypothetical protein
VCTVFCGLFSELLLSDVQRHFLCTDMYPWSTGQSYEMTSIADTWSSITRVYNGKSVYETSDEYNSRLEWHEKVQKYFNGDHVQEHRRNRVVRYVQQIESLYKETSVNPGVINIEHFDYIVNLMNLIVDDDDTVTVATNK